MKISSVNNYCNRVSINKNFSDTKNKTVSHLNYPGREIHFTRKYPSHDIELDLFGPNISERLEKAYVEFSKGIRRFKPEFEEKITESGNKVKTYFQKNTNIPSHTIEVDPSNEVVRTVYFDLDGKTKLMEFIKESDTLSKTLYYNPSDGKVIDEHIFKNKK